MGVLNDTDRGEGKIVTSRAAAHRKDPKTCCAKKVEATAAEMAAGALKAAGRFALSGFKTVDEETYLRRWEACLSCEYLLPAEKEEGRRCALCGCFMKLKAKLPRESCRAGKWR